MSDALFQDVGEKHADFVYRSLRGLGEARAQRLLPVILSVLDEYVAALVEFTGDDVDKARKSAKRGFRIRGAELGYLGSDRPRTLREAWRRRRLGAINELLWTVPTDEAKAYLARLGVDEPQKLSRNGRLWVLPGSHPLLEGNRDGRPLFEPAATHAVLQVVFEDDVLFDFVAWDLADPLNFWTVIGENGSWPNLGSPILGDTKQSPQEPLVVHRTPEAWLANRCVGVVPLSGKAGPDLACADQLVAQDLDHAREIARLIHPFADPRTILVRAK